MTVDEGALVIGGRGVDQTAKVLQHSSATALCCRACVPQQSSPCTLQIALTRC
jgi:hypothetical protein